MSRTEIDRLDVVRRVVERRVTRVDAALQLGLSARQVTRLVQNYERDGADGPVSKRRGKRSNRASTEEYKAQALSIVRNDYADFGPTLVVEHLAERHGMVLSRETVRAWMIEAGIWTDRRTARQRVYQPRYRRECFGELIQIDGSDHAWFEDRAPKACLLVFIDDATSALVDSRSNRRVSRAPPTARRSWSDSVAISRHLSAEGSAPPTSSRCARSTWRGRAGESVRHRLTNSIGTVPPRLRGRPTRSP